MTARDLAVPPCDQDDEPLPPRNARVRHVITGSLGTVHGGAPRRGALWVLRDGATFAGEYHASDWEVVSYPPCTRLRASDGGVCGNDEQAECAEPHLDDEDDGFGEHDADDALYDARREEALS